MKEKNLWAKISNIKGIHWTRIENEAIHGIPDLLGVIQGRFFLCELKIVITERIYLRPAQYAYNKSLVSNNAPTILLFEDRKKLYAQTFEHIFKHWKKIGTVEKYIIFEKGEAKLLGTLEKDRYSNILMLLQENFQW